MDQCIYSTSFRNGSSSLRGCLQFDVSVGSHCRSGAGIVSRRRTEIPQQPRPVGAGLLFLMSGDDRAGQRPYGLEICTLPAPPH